jgi:hypothetical protein
VAAIGVDYVESQPRRTNGMINNTACKVDTTPLTEARASTVHRLAARLGSQVDPDSYLMPPVGIAGLEPKGLRTASHSATRRRDDLRQTSIGEGTRITLASSPGPLGTGRWEPDHGWRCYSTAMGESEQRGAQLGPTGGVVCRSVAQRASGAVLCRLVLPPPALPLSNGSEQDTRIDASVRDGIGPHEPGRSVGRCDGGGESFGLEATIPSGGWEPRKRSSRTAPAAAGPHV